MNFNYFKNKCYLISNLRLNVDISQAENSECRFRNEKVSTEPIKIL